MELSLPAKSSGAKLHRSVRRHSRQHLLFHRRSGVVFARGHSSRVRRGQVAPRQLARFTSHSVDRSLHRLGCLFAATANRPSARLEERFQYSRSGRMGRRHFRSDAPAQFHGQGRFDHSSFRNLRGGAHSHDRSPADSHRSRNRRVDGPAWRQAARMARESATARDRSQRAARNRAKRKSAAAARG